jgi:hypothetical protein
MMFRIVAPHTHRAFMGTDTVTCIRKAVTTEAGLEISWAAYRGDQLLKGDCRTLNEAKNVCRSATNGGVTQALAGE